MRSEAEVCDIARREVFESGLFAMFDRDRIDLGCGRQRQQSITGAQMTGSAFAVPAAANETRKAVLDYTDLPIMVLHDEAVRSNVRTMAQYCADRDVFLAPHAKTSMTDYISRLQIESGAWGLTTATIRQARKLWAMGFSRILLANVVVDRLGIEWIAETFLREVSDGRRIVVYVDSVAGLRLLESHLAESARDRPLDVLVELGFAAGRTGARTIDQLVRVARAVHASPDLRLAGVAGFEGLMDRESAPVPPGLETYLRRMNEATVVCESEGLFEGPPIVSAGGSSFFDLVVDTVGPGRFDFPVTTVLRSGCYATHDHGMYRETSPMDGRRTEGGAFEPALELIASVWSRPEADLVIAGFGRRDAPTDDRLPVVNGRRTRDGSCTELPGVEVFSVNDHHAFVRVPEDSDLGPGDLLSFGISHPCGAFDRWRSLPIVARDDMVIGAAEPKL
ncbi:hypothetical protein GTZ78_04945 [Streptomyces sp. SID8361]|nr:hypothetical protein [Streptomyces sp. SID8361]